jgi:hypothetical protein
MKMSLVHVLRLAVLSAIFFTGCRAARDVAVTSFRVIDAPANYVRRHIDESEGTSSATTATSQSDVVTPGQPLPPSSPPQTTTSRRQTTAVTGPGVDAEQPARTTPSAQTGKIPYAKPVPGKPGYVYSPFDPNGGYVDVTGYAAGSKAKDPYSGKIFIVP